MSRPQCGNFTHSAIAETKRQSSRFSRNGTPIMSSYEIQFNQHVMGNGASQQKSYQARINRIINNNLRREKFEALSTIKLLILGSAECGKTTFIKQMRLIHSDGFTNMEQITAIDGLRANAVESMIAIINARKKFAIKWSKTESKDAAALVVKSVTDHGTPNVGDAIALLWRDKAVRKTVLRRNEFQLMDSAEYFFENVKRIFDVKYQPTVQDMLQMRLRTVGIYEIRLTINNSPFRVFDVGGQRTERRKWIHCFDNVNAVIFVIAISEFDQVLWEDNETNRLDEAIKLYSSTAAIPWFRKIPFLIFLNKRDVFMKKIEMGKSIKTAFPIYDGPPEYTRCVEFIKNRLHDTNIEPSETSKFRALYVNTTCATDTNQVTQVFEAVFDIICNMNLRHTGVS